MERSNKEPNTSMATALKHNLLPKNKLAIIVETEDGPLYCCVKCPAKYGEKEKLEVHLCSHFDEYRFLCGICGTGLKRKEHLDRHTLGHQEVRPHVCPECGKGFKRKEHLNIHLSIHSGDKTQVCPLCQRSFYRKDHLQKHLQTHTKMFMEQNIYPLSDQELMDVKQEVLEDEDIKPVFVDVNGCEVNMEVDGENKTQQIGYLHSSDPQRPFECAMCHKTYKRKDHLKLHCLTHLEKDKICTECGKGFHKEEQLLLHMNVHFGAYSSQTHSADSSVSDMRAMIGNCNIDIMPLDTSELLVPRAGYSPGSRPHECPVCQRKFKRKQHLKVHANVHLKNLQPTIWCSLCNEGFQSNSQFESHECAAREPAGAPRDAKKENNHPVHQFVPIPIVNCVEGASPALLQEAHLPTPQRVYVCKYCQKPFKRKDHYKIHLHIHTGVKSFFCPDCGKGFYRKDHLQKHTQVHQKQKPKKTMPDLYPINMLKKDANIKPEITITAPSNTKLRVPLKIKVPYQMVISSDSGEQRAVTVDPHAAPGS